MLIEFHENVSRQKWVFRRKKKLTFSSLPCKKSLSFQLGGEGEGNQLFTLGLYFQEEKRKERNHQVKIKENVNQNGNVL